MKEKRLSVLYVLLSALLFSLGGVCIKSIPWNALSINSARSIVAIFPVGAYLFFTKHRISLNRYVFLGALCLFGTTTLYVAANKLTTSANTIVLQFTAPLFIIFFMWIFFGEKPKRLEIITCCAVLFGILCFFIDSISSGGTLGNLLALLSGVAYAGVFMLNTFPGADPISSILLGQILSALVGLPFLMRERPPAPAALISILILGFFQLGIAYICLSKGLKHVSPVTASLISGIEPILNPVLVAVVYREIISVTAFFGAVIVLFSIIAYHVIKAKGLETKVP